jgi:predicted DNA-binding transcriptional regulator AlpA
MDNPFETISRRLSNIENLLLAIKHAPKSEAEKPDRIFLKDVIEITGLKAPAIYKETSKHNRAMPCARFGSRLVFSRKEILAWMQENTIKKRSVADKAAEELQAAARKKTAS